MEAKSKDECTNITIHDNKVEPIFDSANVDNITYSPDGKKILVTYMNRKSVLLDSQSGASLLTIKNTYTPYKTLFSNDGEKILIDAHDYQRVIDVKSGKELFKEDTDDYFAYTPRFFSDNGKFFIAKKNNGKLVVFNTDTGKKIIEITTNIDPLVMKVSPDGKKLIVVGKNVTFCPIRVFSIDTGEVLNDISQDDDVRDVEFSPDGSKFVMTSPAGNSKVLETATRKVLYQLETPQVFTNTRFSSDGSKILISSIDSDDSAIKVIDAKTGKSLSVNSGFLNGNRAIFSADEKKIIFIKQNGQIVEADASNGKIVSTHKITNEKIYSFSDKNDKIQVASRSGLVEVAIKNICLKNLKFKNENSDDPINCENNNKIIGNANQLNLIAEQNFLCELTKPGTFKIDPHLENLVAIIKSKSAQKHQDKIKQVLINILMENDELYTELLNKIPELRKILSAKQNKAKNSSCPLSKEDSETVDLAIRNYVKDLPKTLSFKELKEKLLPLYDFLSKLDSKSKEYLWDSVAQNLADTAANDHKYSGVFLSKLYKLTRSATAPLFGEKASLVTDLTVVRTATEIRPILLSSANHKLNFKNKDIPINDYGFFGYELDKATIDPNAKPNSVLVNSKPQWKAGGKSFKSELKMTVMVKGTAVKNEPAPDYKKMWADGLTGMVIIGSNHRKSPRIVDEYISYYQDKKFTCGKKASIPNLKAFMNESISSGKIDYFMKEAHSDGDEKNIFRIDKKSFFIECRNDKTHETVKIIFPDMSKELLNKNEDELVSNNEFGEWIRNREKTNGAPLVYFNSSCWSAKNKAVNEIEAAASPYLTEIPTLTESYTFFNKSFNVKQAMLTGFRDKKNYEEIRKELRKNSNYSNKKIDYFIFPDDPEYDEYIRKVLKIMIKTDHKITDESGKPYNIDSH